MCPYNNFENFAYDTKTSILDSKSNLAFVFFYLIVQKDFDNKNINFLESLYEDYDYFNITFTRMDNR